jgi:hypothetical protein
MYSGPGIYQHYKGGYYRVLGVSQHESGGQRLVIYHSYSVEHEVERMREDVDFVARPLNAADGEDPFNALVTIPIAVYDVLTGKNTREVDRFIKWA